MEIRTENHHFVTNKPSLPPSLPGYRSEMDGTTHTSYLLELLHALQLFFCMWPSLLRRLKIPIKAKIVEDLSKLKIIELSPVQCTIG